MARVVREGADAEAGELEFDAGAEMVTFAEVGGLADVKKACGKTLLARATAGECGLPFLNLRIEEILDPFFGASEQKLHRAFALARAAAPCALFVEIVLRGRPQAKLDLRGVAAKAALFSGADLRAVVERATDSAIDDTLSQGRERPLTMTHLTDALAEIRPSTVDWIATAATWSSRRHGSLRRRTGVPRQQGGEGCEAEPAAVSRPSSAAEPAALLL